MKLYENRTREELLDEVIEIENINERDLDMNFEVYFDI